MGFLYNPAELAIGRHHGDLIYLPRSLFVWPALTVTHERWMQEAKMAAAHDRSDSLARWVLIVVLLCLAVVPICASVLTHDYWIPAVFASSALGLVAGIACRSGDWIAYAILNAVLYTVVRTALYFLLFYGGWGLLAWLGAVAPPSPIGGWALIALGIVGTASDFNSRLEAQEKSTGVSGFWGPYRRQAAIGAFAGAAGLWLLVRYRAFDLTDSPVVNFVVWSAFVAAGAFAWVISCAGRRRDRPLLPAIDDAMDGFIAGAGVMSAVLAFAVWHASTDGQIDQRAEYVLVVICGALGAGVNVWRRSERGVSLDGMGRFDGD
jgi:hypothetical protein